MGCLGRLGPSGAVYCVKDEWGHGMCLEGWSHGLCLGQLGPSGAMYCVKDGWGRVGSWYVSRKAGVMGCV